MPSTLHVCHSAYVVEASKPILAAVWVFGVSSFLHQLPFWLLKLSIMDRRAEITNVMRISCLIKNVLLWFVELTGWFSSVG
jgi:hypothetical protein